MDQNIKNTKILAIFGLISIIQALIIIYRTVPANGYELSIYDVYPWYFWLFIFLSTASGILILLFQTFEEKISNQWLIGFWIIILSNMIILGMPFFRGYFLYPIGDALTHLGQ